VFVSLSVNWLVWFYVGISVYKRTEQLDSVRRAIKIKNKAKKKANSETKKTNQSKNKSKKDWQQR
jgi:hypothetical protein